MLDLFVEFGALVAHGGTLSNRKTGATLIGCMMESTAGMGICSPVSNSKKGERVHPGAGPGEGWPGSLARPEQRLYPLETARQMLRRILYARTVLRIQ